MKQTEQIVEQEIIVVPPDEYVGSKKVKAMQWTGTNLLSMYSFGCTLGTVEKCYMRTIVKNGFKNVTFLYSLVIELEPDWRFELDQFDYLMEDPYTHLVTVYKPEEFKKIFKKINK